MTPAALTGETLQELEAAQARATPGDWTWNCAGEIFAHFEGERVRIGHFQGSELEAAAVCQLHNHAQSLIAAAKSSAA